MGGACKRCSSLQAPACHQVVGRPESCQVETPQKLHHWFLDGWFGRCGQWGAVKGKADFEACDHEVRRRATLTLMCRVGLMHAVADLDVQRRGILRCRGYPHTCKFLRLDHARVKGLKQQIQGSSQVYLGSVSTCKRQETYRCERFAMSQDFGVLIAEVTGLLGSSADPLRPLSVSPRGLLREKSYGSYLQQLLFRHTRTAEQ
eukprot:1142191-Pelagomonas_calceolata.AAC.12